MGPQHTIVLEKIFGVFYKLSLTLASILRSREQFTIDDVTQDQLVTTYSELLSVVVEITTTYQKRSRCMFVPFCEMNLINSAKSSSNAEDLDSMFGRKIDIFFQQRDKVSDTIWTCQLERDVDLGSKSSRNSDKED